MEDRKASRRAVLKALALLAGGAAGLGLAAANPASAQQKVAKQAVNYQDKPNGAMKCSDCQQFIAPGSCKIVADKISPNGYCVEWARKG